MDVVPLYQEMINRKIDYLCMLIVSLPSIHQPGYRGYAHAGVCKLTVDSRALEVINRAYSAMRFECMQEMLDAYTRMLFSLCSDCSTSGDVCFYSFSGWLINRIEPDNSEIEFDKDLLFTDDVSDFIEYLLITIAEYAASNNEALLSRLCRDTQSITLEEAKY